MKKLQLSKFIKSAFHLVIFDMAHVSCGRARPNPNNPDSGDNNNSDNEENSIKININSKYADIFVNDQLSFSWTVSGTDKTEVMWDIVQGNEFVEIIDAYRGQFLGIKEGSAQVKAFLTHHPEVVEYAYINVINNNDGDTITTIQDIHFTESSEFKEVTVEGTLVSLYKQGTEDSYSGLIYDGTAVLPLFKFVKVSQGNSTLIQLGDTLRIKGTPNRYNENYWAQINGEAGNIAQLEYFNDNYKYQLPPAINWIGDESSSYSENHGGDFQHIVADVEAVKVGNYINYKIIGSSEAGRMLCLNYTPNDEWYTREGARAKMEFVTGDIKVNGTLIAIYPISISPLNNLLIDSQKTEINVNEKIDLTLLNDGSPVSEGITWTSSNETVATVENGVVTGISSGKVTITATLGVESASIIITVLPNVTDYVYQASEKTIAECNAETLDPSKLYIVEGIISEVKGTSVGAFYMTADGNAATGDDVLYVYYSCFGQEALSFDGTNWSYNYKNGYQREDFYTVGRRVKILCFIADNYDGKRFRGVILTEDPYWLAEKATVYEVLENNIDPSKLYITEAYVTSIEKVKNGRFHASTNNDGTGKDLYVYSSGFYNDDPTVLSKKDNGTWNYNNKKATAPTETTLTVGDKVTLVVYRSDYNSTKEVTGVIYDIEVGELQKAVEDVPERYSEVIEYDFTNLKTGSLLDAVGALEFLNSALSEETTRIIDSVKNASCIYNGNTPGGPGAMSCFKFGRNGTAGSITFTTSAEIGKIEFTYHPWSVFTYTNINIGNRKIKHKATEGYATPIVDSIAFESTNEVTISTDTEGDTRVCILKLKLYVVA